MTANMNTIAATLEKFIKSRPGFDYANYGDRHSYRYSGAYRADVREVGKQRGRALAALEEFRALDWHEDAYKEAQRSFSGRLDVQIDGEKVNIEYTAGQYWCTEYRLAAAVWLETYNQAARPKPTLMEDETLLNAWRAVDAAHRAALDAHKPTPEVHADERAALKAAWIQNDLRSTDPRFDALFGKHYLYFGYDRMFKDWVIVPCHVDEREAVHNYLESRGMKQIDSTRFYESLPFSVQHNGAVCASWRFHALDVEPPYDHC